MRLAGFRAGLGGVGRSVTFFFGTYMLDFAIGSSLSLVGYGLMDCGQFTDLRRFYFGFRLSLGESHGFLGPEQSHFRFVAL